MNTTFQATQRRRSTARACCITLPEPAAAADGRSGSSRGVHVNPDDGDISQPRYENEEGVVGRAQGAGVLFSWPRPGPPRGARGCSGSTGRGVYGQDAAVATFERAIWSVGDFGPVVVHAPRCRPSKACAAAGPGFRPSSIFRAHRGPGNAQTLLLGVRSVEVCRLAANFRFPSLHRNFRLIWPRPARVDHGISMMQKRRAASGTCRCSCGPEAQGARRSGSSASSASSPSWSCSADQRRPSSPTRGNRRHLMLLHADGRPGLGYASAWRDSRSFRLAGWPHFRRLADSITLLARAGGAFGRHGSTCRRASSASLPDARSLCEHLPNANQA